MVHLFPSVRKVISHSAVIKHLPSSHNKVLRKPMHN